MHRPPLPLTRDLVLIGGGHTHALVLRKWAMDPLPGTRLTLINPGPTAPYSGMLPGFVAGHYTRYQLDIDLVCLAQAANARVIMGAAEGMDLGKGDIHVEGRRPVAFDVASIDVGITSAMPMLPGFAEYGIPAKPLGPFAQTWDRFRQGNGPARIALIGGGVAGAELAMAMAHALKEKQRQATIHIIDAATAFSALPAKSADRLRACLAAQAIVLHEHKTITQLSEGRLHFDDGTALTADFITGAAGAWPYPWLAQTGLEVEDGFVTVDRHLQTSDPRVFAVGDCAHMSFDPRPKAGVYAVRQAPTLVHNLKAVLSGGALRAYKPQKDYLKLVSLGDKSAIGDRFGMTIQGPWVWRWKDRIDRAFMDQFNDLPQMPQPPLPQPHALGLREAIGPKPLCGGCGAKLGRDALSEALAMLKPPQRTDVTALPGDDAALLETGGVRQVMTTDHLRSFWPDPTVMARIAAHHALGDIWAMGAAPQAATLSLTLPRLSNGLARRMMQDILAGIEPVLRDAGADIVGGHSTIGDELTLGLCVTGLCDAPPLTLGGAQPGDCLILTKPIGTGVIMAAHMARQARGADVISALNHMQSGQGRASRALRTEATAMTDVTGFGLAGHVQNICVQSGCSAEIELDAVPLLPGALALSTRGVASSLYPSNRGGFENIEVTPRANLLFDPQTSGGLLAAVPESKSETCLKALQENGYDQACIVGRLASGPVGQVSILRSTASI